MEYVLLMGQSFMPRFYSGVILTYPRSNCGAGVSPCDVSANALLAGVKVRLMKPLILIGPFFEAGIGATAGRLATRSGTARNVTKTGFTYHVPASFGLAIGPHYEYDLAFRIFVHPAARQVAVVIGLGFGFPLF